MTILRDLRERWFASSLSIAAALFFTGALLFSAYNYVTVMDARQSAALVNPVEGLEVLDNGSLVVSLTIDFGNPSAQVIVVSSISWAVRVYNHTETGTWVIPITTEYTAPTERMEVGPNSLKSLEYTATVSDPQTLSALQGFINYSVSNGDDMSLETIPFSHDLRVLGWIDDYEHDYDYSGERYLNDLVKIDKRYYTYTEVPL